MTHLFDCFESCMPRFVTPKQREAAIRSIGEQSEGRPLAVVVRALRRETQPGNDPRPTAAVVRLSTLRRLFEDHVWLAEDASRMSGGVSFKRLL